MKVFTQKCGYCKAETPHKRTLLTNHILVKCEDCGNEDYNALPTQPENRYGVQLKLNLV